MFSFLRKLFSGHKSARGHDIHSGTTTRTWTKEEPERVRTYQQTIHESSGGGCSVSVSLTQELATSRQLEFLRRLGLSGETLTREDASHLIDRALRPIDGALAKTFQNIQILPKEHLRALQIALAHWDYCPKLPGYGPYDSVGNLIHRGHDPYRPLTKNERIAVTDLAVRILPPDLFLSLQSNGIKKYKVKIDEKLTTSR